MLLYFHKMEANILDRVDEFENILEKNYAKELNPLTLSQKTKI